jgi:hypothetical protein
MDNGLLVFGGLLQNEVYSVEEPFIRGRDERTPATICYTLHAQQVPDTAF